MERATKRSDGKTAAQIAAHAADVAEVCCAKMDASYYPLALTAIVHDETGEVDLSATAATLQRNVGSLGNELYRLQCAMTLGTRLASEEADTYWVERLVTHTSEHIEEISSLIEQ